MAFSFLSILRFPEAKPSSFLLGEQKEVMLCLETPIIARS
jgi:hypothetical protein